MELCKVPAGSVDGLVPAWNVLFNVFLNLLFIMYVLFVFVYYRLLVVLMLCVISLVDCCCAGLVDPGLERAEACAPAVLVTCALARPWPMKFEAPNPNESPR